MSSGFLSYSGYTEILTTPTAGPGTTVTQNPDNSFEIGVSSAGVSGLPEQCYGVVLISDYVPTTSIASQNALPGYTAAAEFATITLSPEGANTNSIFYLDINYQGTFDTSLTAAETGIIIAFYSSNTTGAPEVVVTPAIAGATPAAVVNTQQAMNQLGIFSNTTGAAQTIYLCAYIISGTVNPLVLGSNSASTNQFKGASYSSIVITEVQG